ncbi:MAG: hypothetical protein MHM6MM_002977 [Cercozoa sp. M6MM]
MASEKVNPRVFDIEKKGGYTFLHTRLDGRAAEFSDVRVVLVMGPNQRAEKTAHDVYKKLCKLPKYASLIDRLEECLSPIGSTERYAMYKVGPVLVSSHGMGIPTLSILLNEIAVLMALAGNDNYCIIRTGTCGGIGLKPGSVVISRRACDGLCRPYLELPVCGEVQRRPGLFDGQICDDLLQLSKDLGIEAVEGFTMTASDFFEGQGRLDGAIADHGAEKRLEWLRSLKEHGVNTIEMEGLQLAAFGHHLNIPTGMVCVALLNRLDGDQVLAPHHDIVQWTGHARRVILEFIAQRVQ